MAHDYLSIHNRHDSALYTTLRTQYRPTTILIDAYLVEVSKNISVEFSSVVEIVRGIVLDLGQEKKVRTSVKIYFSPKRTALNAMRA